MVKRLPKDERRRQILSAVLPVLARRGVAATTTRDLAAAAGVTEPILYRHFRTKQALFRAVLSEVEARLVAALEALLEGVAPRARIDRLVQALPGLLERCEDELRVLNGAAASHTDPAQVRAVRGVMARLAAVLATALQPVGLRRGLPAPTAALFLLEIGLGASLLHAVGAGGLAGDDYRARVSGLLATALVGP